MVKILSIHSCLAVRNAKIATDSHPKLLVYGRDQAWFGPPLVMRLINRSRIVSGHTPRDCWRFEQSALAEGFIVKSDPRGHMSI